MSNPFAKIFGNKTKSPGGQESSPDAQSSPDAGPTALFFAPHQDDELLTMGAYACEAIARGVDCHAVLCSDGSRSCVRGVLADGQTCGKHPGEHSFDLDLDAFSDARDREFLASCQAIGYRPSRIHFHPDRAIDGQLSVAKAREIIQHHLRIFPHAEVCTISPVAGADQHRDHKALGQAALELYREGAIEALTLFIEPYCLTAFKEGNPAVAVEQAAPDAVGVARLKDAMAQYCEWRPERGRYAVGYHSVTSEFDDFAQNPCSWYYHERA